jgi:hypothetical protein
VETVIILFLVLLLLLAAVEAVGVTHLVKVAVVVLVVVLVGILLGLLKLAQELLVKEMQVELLALVMVQAVVVVLELLV